MTTIYLQAAAILCGFIGSFVMFSNGHVLKPYPGGMFAPDNYEDIANQITRDNKRIVFMQRFGMLFLCVSFALQGAALCIST